MIMSDSFRVAKQQDIPLGSGVISEVQGRSIAIFNVAGKFYAIGNHCPHRGGPLGEGELKGPVVTCPWHGWTFNVVTGMHPENQRIKVPVYPVQLSGDEVWIQLD